MDWDSRSRRRKAGWLPPGLGYLIRLSFGPIMQRMGNSKVTHIRIPDEIRKALEAAAEASGVSLTVYLLTSSLEKAGKPELAKQIRSRGQPRKANE